MIKIKSISLLPSIPISTNQSTKAQKPNPKRINSQFLNNYFKPLPFSKHSKSIVSISNSNNSKCKIPSNNLPKLKQTSNQSRNLSKSKHIHNKSLHNPEALNIPINSESEPTFVECKPQIGFFLFPRRKPKPIKQPKKKEKKDFSVSSWRSESSPFLFTIPTADIP